MEDPFEKPLPTRDEHLRWSLADVAPEMGGYLKKLQHQQIEDL